MTMIGLMVAFAVQSMSPTPPPSTYPFAVTWQDDVLCAGRRSGILDRHDRSQLPPLCSGFRRERQDDEAAVRNLPRFRVLSRTGQRGGSRDSPPPAGGCGV